MLLRPRLGALRRFRWETASAALARALAGILIAHLGGGDVTEAVQLFGQSWRAHGSQCLVWGEEAPLSQLGKNRAGGNGVEKFWMALPIREAISNVTRK
jgi:hypothetical protein